MNTIIKITSVILTILFLQGCMKEELEYCSCSTIVYNEFGDIISRVNNTEETPPDGNCFSLEFSDTNQETGHLTWKRCS